MINDVVFFKEIKYGRSRRKVENCLLSLSNISEIEGGGWTYRIITTGPFEQDRKFEANSAFECLTFGLSGLRQTLQLVVQQDPKVKFYELFDGDLDEVSVKDIFWTHDCIPEDLEIAYDWAIKNGFKSE